MIKRKNKSEKIPISELKLETFNLLYWQQSLNLIYCLKSKLLLVTRYIPMKEKYGTDYPILITPSIAANRKCIKLRVST